MTWQRERDRETERERERERESEMEEWMRKKGRKVEVTTILITF